MLVRNFKVKEKVNCTLVQALRLCTGRTAPSGIRGIALLFLGHGTRRSEGSASRPGRCLTPGKTRYPLYRRLGGPQCRSGQMRKNSPPPGFDPRTVQTVASRYTDWATRSTKLRSTPLNYSLTKSLSRVNSSYFPAEVFSSINRFIIWSFEPELLY